MEWTSQLEKEILDLKASLTSETILKAPDFDRPLTLHTDASARGIGAVLNQIFEEVGERPVAYYSKKLKPAQSRYTATRRSVWRQ